MDQFDSTMAYPIHLAYHFERSFASYAWLVQIET